MAAKDAIREAILKAMAELSRNGFPKVSSTELSQHIKSSPATLKRHLESLANDGKIIVSGKARSTRYSLPPSETTTSPEVLATSGSSEFHQTLSPQSTKILQQLERPMGSRTPVTYQRKFVDQYLPNETYLLTKDRAESLYRQGRMRDQQPAGTYVRKVLEQLLIDLSWSSSYLEGNRYTLLATEELFRRGTSGEDRDAIMLLNHKRAIEFMVDAVPEIGLTTPLIRNLHALLMQDLLPDTSSLGEIRSKIVNISDTVYLPSQIPSLLGEMLEKIITKVQLIKNPIEAAFFLWINISYLQPFEDGNKRTSRLASNIPLMMYNCAPLSFLHVDQQDYAHAMMGVYELNNVAIAADLFTWVYTRSVQKYAAVLESMGLPDPFRVKFREHLNAAIQQIVVHGIAMSDAVQGLRLSSEDEKKFIPILRDELATLSTHNCARYRLSLKTTEQWIAGGRLIG